MYLTSAVITPHVCDVSGLIVLTLSVCVSVPVCVSVRLNLTAEWTDLRT